MSGSVNDLTALLAKAKVADDRYLARKYANLWKKAAKRPSLSQIGNHTCSSSGVTRRRVKAPLLSLQKQENKAPPSPAMQNLVLGLIEKKRSEREHQKAVEAFTTALKEVRLQYEKLPEDIRAELAGNGGQALESAVSKCLQQLQQKG
mmetsp:Transcript_43372/g.109526  ORF Transcript_43372/g.109526 Transcript_43372/m.109526 type:complete len:148 (-) Transcript_43372:124-567(-)